MPAWVTMSFPTIRIIMIVLIVLLSIAVIVAIFIQPAGSGQMGAITGQATETYYSKNKKQSLESVMKKLTTGLGISIAVLSILFFVSIAIYPPT